MEAIYHSAHTHRHSKSIDHRTLRPNRKDINTGDHYAIAKIYISPPSVHLVISRDTLQKLIPISVLALAPWLRTLFSICMFPVPT